MAIRVSIIVPTYNRKDLLLRLLESLLRQTLPREEFEVIVVSDGSTDGTNECVRGLCDQHPQLRLVEQSQGGPAAARNAGARLARGNYFAFTDDDCVASMEWLENLIEPFRQIEVVAVEGRTTTVLADCTPLTHQMESHGNLGVLATCNAACRRDAFERLGGFEQGFPFPHNEDADLAWRLEFLGTVYYAAEAWIIHPPRPESFVKKALWVRYLESEFLLFSRHPVAYRKHRSPSPWVTIYWRIFVISQFHKIGSALKQLFFRFRIDYFGIILGLIAARWWILIWSFLRFRRAARILKADRLVEGLSVNVQGRLSKIGR